MKCLKVYLPLLLYFLIATTTVGYASDTRSSNQDTVSMTSCMRQIEKISKIENDCRSELSKTRIELEKTKGKRSSLVEKLGIATIGGAIVASQFNAVGLVVGGWLIIFN